MNLGELEQELALIVRDESLRPYFRDWLNQALLEIAADFNLPGLKLVEPRVFPVNSRVWLYDLPGDFMKNLFRVRSGPEKLPVTILREISGLDLIDAGHTETGERVTKVAVTGNQLGIYPLADDTLYLWYHRKPVPMELPSDEPDGIPAPYRTRVLIPKVVIRNFRLLQDMMVSPPHESLAWWMEEYRTGLYGGARGEIGMLNYFAREKGPRRHGGRDPLP